MTYEKRFERFKNMAEEAVSRVIVDFTDTPKVLKEAIIYSLSNGGKRVRPVIFFAAHSLFISDKSEKKGDVAIQPSAELLAVAIECIHTYSLIHDDLPCMDNDDFRRGQPTSHKVYGEAMAVLAGDALLNLAYELCFKAIILSDYNKNYVKAAAKIATLAGMKGLIAGQSLDTSIGSYAESFNDPCDFVLRDEVSNSFDYIYRHKTADLFIASVYAGALTAGADEDSAEHLANFAKDFGYAFQIQDDLLDKYENHENSSQPVSFVDMVGTEHSEKIVKETIDNAIESLNKLNKDTDFLKEFALRSIGRKV